MSRSLGPYRAVGKGKEATQSGQGCDEAKHRHGYTFLVPGCIAQGTVVVPYRGLFILLLTRTSSTIVFRPNIGPWWALSALVGCDDLGHGCKLLDNMLTKQNHCRNFRFLAKPSFSAVGWKRLKPHHSRCRLLLLSSRATMTL